MEIIGYITLYILGVFLARELNKSLVKRDTINPIWNRVWLIPYIGFIVFLFLWICDSLVRTVEWVHIPKSKFGKWFNGHGWRK